ncbi:hypothetical protein NM962_16275 [Mycobacterium sp. SVM_VP21]|nr:hypothetical protein NM962_16275 [Mycobacterium sp. SVM_VP21]
MHIDVMALPQPLAKVTGKFRFGLGTQVRTHVVRRYGAAVAEGAAKAGRSPHRPGSMRSVPC